MNEIYLLWIYLLYNYFVSYFQKTNLKGDIMNYLKSKRDYLLDIFIIILGAFIASIGVNLFLSHAKLLSGGATGVGLIIQYMTGFQAGFSVFLINLPLFIVSYFKMKKKFTINWLSIMLISVFSFNTILNICLFIHEELAHLVIR